MSIETDHAGEKIGYSENEDVWRCWALDLEAATLSALKTKINQWKARKRRLENVAVLVPEGSYSSKFHEGQATLIDKDEMSVWIMMSGRSAGRSSDDARKKIKFSDVLLDTPETRKAVLELEQAVARQRVAEAESKRLREALPYATLERFQHLAVDDLDHRTPKRKK